MYTTSATQKDDPEFVLLRDSRAIPNILEVPNGGAIHILVHSEPSQAVRLHRNNPPWHVHILLKPFHLALAVQHLNRGPGDGAEVPPLPVFKVALELQEKGMMRANVQFDSVYRYYVQDIITGWVKYVRLWRIRNCLRLWIDSSTYISIHGTGHLRVQGLGREISVHTLHVLAHCLEPVNGQWIK